MMTSIGGGSVTMPADSSTQNPPRRSAPESASQKRATKRKKLLQERRARKLRRNAGKKSKGSSRGHSKQRDDSASDCDSDLDLRNELQPIGLYVHHREEMLEHLFRSISTRKLRAMLPEPCRTLSLDDLKALCLEQLDAMSRKRILRILAGADPDIISSTDSDEDSSDANNEPEGEESDGPSGTPHVQYGSEVSSSGSAQEDGSQSQYIDSTSLQEDHYSEGGAHGQAKPCAYNSNHEEDYDVPTDGEEQDDEDVDDMSIEGKTSSFHEECDDGELFDGDEEERLTEIKATSHNDEESEEGEVGEDTEQQRADDELDDIEDVGEEEITDEIIEEPMSIQIAQEEQMEDTGTLWVTTTSTQGARTNVMFEAEDTLLLEVSQMDIDGLCATAPPSPEEGEVLDEVPPSPRGRQHRYRAKKSTQQVSRSAKHGKTKSKHEKKGNIMETVEAEGSEGTSISKASKKSRKGNKDDSCRRVQKTAQEYSIERPIDNQSSAATGKSIIKRDLSPLATTSSIEPVALVKVNIIAPAKSKEIVIKQECVDDSEATDPTANKAVTTGSGSVSSLVNSKIEQQKVAKQTPITVKGLSKAACSGPAKSPIGSPPTTEAKPKVSTSTATQPSGKPVVNVITNVPQIPQAGPASNVLPKRTRIVRRPVLQNKAYTITSSIQASSGGSSQVKAPLATTPAIKPQGVGKAIMHTAVSTKSMAEDVPLAVAKALAQGKSTTPVLVNVQLGAKGPAPIKSLRKPQDKMPASFNVPTPVAAKDPLMSFKAPVHTVAKSGGRIVLSRPSAVPKPQPPQTTAPLPKKKLRLVHVHGVTTATPVVSTPQQSSRIVICDSQPSSSSVAPARKVQLKRPPAAEVSEIPTSSRTVIKKQPAQSHILKRAQPSEVPTSSMAGGIRRKVIKRIVPSTEVLKEEGDDGATDDSMLSENQMEILELEMRARAIKAMLKGGANTKK